jgi:fumarylpyruvate hydrolase
MVGFAPRSRGAFIVLETEMTFVFDPAPVPAIPVADADSAFPVRRIYCVGRNYAAHAREMGHDPDREPPFFFSKPADAVVYVAPGQTGRFVYPPETSDCHYEMELVVAIGRHGANIDVADAGDYVWGYALGLDMTRRDLQAQMKKAGRPWEVAKGFDGSAPIGPIHPKAAVGALDSGAIWLNVNGEQRQRGDLSDMIWSVEETIAYLSHLFELRAGDLIFTGTPDGVGPVARGDSIEAGIDGLGAFRVDVV